MRIPRLAGRAFHPTGEKSPVVVVSRALAERLWPAVSPLGRPLYFDDGQIIARVVGVVGDVRHRELASGDDGTIYALQDQYPAVFNTLAVRAEGSPLALASAVRYALWTVDADQPVWKIRTVESLIDRSVAARRFLLQIVTFFGVSAAALAVVGLYAVVAAGVARRTREIGLRIALGATRTGVLRLVVLNGMRLGAAGVVLGLLAATLAGNLVRSYLFGVTAGDPLTYAAAALLLLVSSLTACWIPARRALHVDPVVALRQG
jgi:putative ABC transport system permease protein